MANFKDIFTWAWFQRIGEQRRPDEPRYSIKEAVGILSEYCSPDIAVSEKRLRDYEDRGLLNLRRAKRKKRKYAIADLLMAYIVLSGTKYFGAMITKLVVRFYQVARKQPRRFNPTVLDYDPSKLDREKNVADILDNPMMIAPFIRVRRLTNLVTKVEEFVKFNRFILAKGYGFFCHADELLSVPDDEHSGHQISPPITDWRSVRKARLLRQYFVAAEKLKKDNPLSNAEYQDAERQIDEKILQTLIRENLVMKLKNKKRKTR